MFQLCPLKGLYAQNLILVNLILVNFVFLGITRHRGSYEGRHLVEMNPTSLPELSKPSRDLLELRKVKFLETTKILLRAL